MKKKSVPASLKRDLKNITEYWEETLGSKKLVDYSTYSPKLHPELLIEMCREGKTRAEVCNEWGIHRKTFTQWLDKYPDFKEAYLIAREAFEAFWTATGRNIAHGKIFRANTMAWIFFMKNNLGWRDEGFNTWADDEDVELEILME